VTRRPGLAALGLALLLAPRLAQACPMCASQQPGGVARILALGVMILLPFGITFLVFRRLHGHGAPASSGGVPSPAEGKRPGEPAAPLKELRP